MYGSRTSLLGEGLRGCEGTHGELQCRSAQAVLSCFERRKERNIQYIARGKRVPLTLEMEYKLVNKTVLSLVRKQLGLENPHIFPTAGAYVSPEVEEFVHSVGINMIVGYGLTESLATVTCDHIGQAIYYRFSRASNRRYRHQD